MKIEKIDLKDPIARARYERILKRVQKKLKPIVDAVRDSQRITAKDLAVTVNCK